MAAAPDTAATADTPPTPVTVRNHYLGVILVVTVAIIWVLSSESIQYVFGSIEFDKPLCFTYYSISLFSVYLLLFLRPSHRAKFRTTAQETQQQTSPHVLRIALILTPLFFFANLTFNYGLSLTSVSSTSTVSTLTTLFTLFLGECTRIERISSMKLVATIITIVGVYIIGKQDKSIAQSHLIGDLISILSALIYACYTLALKYFTERYSLSISMVLSFVGLFTAIFALPLFPLFHYLNIEPFQFPSSRVLLLFTINSLIGTVLSDYLYAKSVTLTTAVIATLALSLTVPLSLVSDYFFQHVHFSVPYLAGATLVVTAFVIVNIEEVRKQTRQPDRHSSQPIPSTPSLTPPISPPPPGPIDLQKVTLSALV